MPLTGADLVYDQPGRSLVGGIFSRDWIASGFGNGCKTGAAADLRGE
jgi:hypothetical protein